MQLAEFYDRLIIDLRYRLSDRENTLFAICYYCLKIMISNAGNFQVSLHGIEKTLGNIKIKYETL